MTHISTAFRLLLSRTRQQTSDPSIFTPTTRLVPIPALSTPIFPPNRPPPALLLTLFSTDQHFCTSHINPGPVSPPLSDNDTSRPF
jgi:hypothetical protein